MGNTASSCTILNAALYAIEVELFSANDAEEAAAKQRYSLLPGQSVKMKVKKSASIRLSGAFGSKENIMRCFICK